MGPDLVGYFWNGCLRPMGWCRRTLRVSLRVMSLFFVSVLIVQWCFTMAMARCTRRDPGCRSGYDVASNTIPTTRCCHASFGPVHRFRHRHGRPSYIPYKGRTGQRLPQPWYLGYRSQRRQQPIRILGILGLSGLSTHHCHWIRILVPKGTIIETIDSVR